MTDFSDLVRQIAHLAGHQQIASAIREDRRAENVRRLNEMAVNYEPTRLYADPLILAAECAAVKARSRAKYGKTTHG